MFSIAIPNYAIKTTKTPDFNGNTASTKTSNTNTAIPQQNIQRAIDIDRLAVRC
jgi:hypothetical protein